MSFSALYNKLSALQTINITAIKDLQNLSSNRGVAKNGGTRGVILWWHLYRPKNRWRPKKKSSLQTELVFSPKVCDDKKKKRFLRTNQWVFGLKKKQKNKWCHPKRVTPGAGRPPSPPSLATPLSGNTLPQPKQFAYHSYLTFVGFNIFHNFSFIIIAFAAFWKDLAVFLQCITRQKHVSFRNCITARRRASDANRPFQVGFIRSANRSWSKRVTCFVCCCLQIQVLQVA